VSIAAVILAAGASTRMGRSKLLLEIEGEALIHRTARAALKVGCEPVVVVLGAEVEALEEALKDLPALISVNSIWEEGMASSIRWGLAQLSESIDAAMVLVSDQPALDADVLSRLMHAHHQDPQRVIACAYAGFRGVPALFPKSEFKSLNGLQGDRGAKVLLQGEAVIEVPWEPGALDLDTPQDFQRWIRRYSASS
jgi:molybdenum cofactor cytidylyltransferase